MTITYRCAAAGPLEPGVIEEVVELLESDEGSPPAEIAKQFLRTHFSHDPAAWEEISRISVEIRSDRIDARWFVALEPMTVMDFDLVSVVDSPGVTDSTQGILLMDNDRALPDFVEVQCDDDFAGQAGYPDSDEDATLRLAKLAGSPGMAFWQTDEDHLIPIPTSVALDEDYESPGFCVVPRHVAKAVFPEEQVP